MCDISVNFEYQSGNALSSLGRGLFYIRPLLTSGFWYFVFDNILLAVQQAKRSLSVVII